MRDETMEKFYDLLQNIECAILVSYEQDAALLDLEVIDGLEGLIRRYAAEEQNRTSPKLHLSDRASRVYTAVERMCEWRLGRAPLNEGDVDTEIPPDQRNTVADILVCLKRVKKSVNIWNEQAGRQGYLGYISQFLSRMERSGA